MKLFSTLILFIFLQSCYSQTFDEQILKSNSLLKGLSEGDSIYYYQCHVEEGTQQLVTVSGQTLTGKPQPYTITEKFVLTKKKQNYTVKYYTSSLTLFPNKKFSGLKIREKDYWSFKEDTLFLLTETGLNVLLSLEKNGREAMEYDYPITKYTTNQLIIKHKKNFKQLIIENPYFISKLIHINRS